MDPAQPPAVSPASHPLGSPVDVPQPNLAAALIGAIVAAIVGAMVWAMITVSAKAQIGFMALGVGFLVAWAVRTLGKGTSQPFGVIGAVFALLGCILGNLLSACAFVSEAQGLPLTSVATRVLTSAGTAVSLLQAAFNPMDLLFYALATYEGYKLSRRRLPVASPTGQPPV